MPDQQSNSIFDAPESRPPHLLTALRIAILGSALLALLECGVIALLLQHHFDDGLSPAPLILAAIGKAALTNFLMWCPILALLGLLYGAMPSRARRAYRRRNSGAAGLWLVMSSCSGLAAIPAVARITHEKSDAFQTKGYVVVAILSLGGCLLISLLRRTLSQTAARKALNGATAIACIIIAACGVMFARSPIFGPAAYAMPEGRAQRFKPEHPHVLWIDLDTLRADYMSCHGYEKPTTPFLDEWAKQSVVFDHCVSDGIWTVPSHASMFTGLPVRQHGVDWGNLWLDDGFSTVAERLRDAGYNTACFSSNPWLTEKTNLLQGFDFLRKVFYVRRLGICSGDYMGELLGLIPPLPWLDADYGAALTHHWVGDWLDANADSERPMFLFVHYMEAHLPYAAPSPYRRKFMTPAQIARSYDIAEGPYGNIVAMPFRYNTNETLPLQETDYDVLRRQYEASLRYLDDRVRELIDQFERRGLLDDTLVVINSDHGEYLGTHGMWGHLAQTYHDVAHVTLMLRKPGGTGEPSGTGETCGTGYRPVTPSRGSGVQPVNPDPGSREHGGAGSRPTSAEVVGIDMKGLRVKTPVQHSDLYGTILTAALGKTPEDVTPTARDLFELARTVAHPPKVAPPPSAVSPGDDSDHDMPPTGATGPHSASGLPELEDPDATLDSPRLAVIQCTTDVAIRSTLAAALDPDLKHRAAGQRAILDGRFKLILSDDGRRELYDLLDDPAEQRNLIDTRPDVAQRLSDALAHWETQTPAYDPKSNLASPALDPQTLDALRSLGYIGHEH